MALTEAIQFSDNWQLKGIILDKLHHHDQTGQLNKEERIFIGNSRKLDTICSAFTEQIPISSHSSKRLFVRRSCVDPISKKYTIVSLYLSNKPIEGRKTVYQATWTPPSRVTDANLILEMQQTFHKLLHEHSFTPNELVFEGGFDTEKFSLMTSAQAHSGVIFRRESNA